MRDVNQAEAANGRSIRSEAPASSVQGQQLRDRSFDYLIVGAGFAGSVLAERLAAGLNKTVLVVDRRPHIGGNAFDFHDEAGVLVHRYGPHIFHTNSQRIVDYLSRFTQWRRYEHRVLAQVDGQLLPIPINRDTLNALYGLQMTTEVQAAEFLASRAEAVDDIRTSEDVVINQIGRELYEKQRPPQPHGFAVFDRTDDQKSRR